MASSVARARENNAPVGQRAMGLAMSLGIISEARCFGIPLSETERGIRKPNIGCREVTPVFLEAHTEHREDVLIIADDLSSRSANQSSEHTGENRLLDESDRPVAA